MLGHFIPSGGNAYRPHLLRKPWLLFFLTVVLTAEGFFTASIIAGESAKNFLSAVLPGEVIALTNTERVREGDGTLAENPLLMLAAQNKAKDMATKGYFSHTGPGGKSPWNWITEAGYSYQAAGENLAVRFDESSDVVNAWMASPTHRANIVKPVYTEIGVGTAQGVYEGIPATYVVQYFGTPQKIASASAASVSEAAEPKAPQSGGAEVAGASTQKVTEEVSAVVPAVEAAVSAPAPAIETRLDQASTRETVQMFLRVNSASGTTVAWIIGGIAALMILLLALAFFVHIEIQPADMLMSGAFVGIVAISFLMLNASVFGAGSGSQTAGVAGAVTFSRSVLVGPSGIFIEGDSAVAPTARE